MKQHNLIQGTPEWNQHRASHFNASDAPAMMGKSPYKTRSKLLDELATGMMQEVDVATQRIFNDGHRFEALARPLAEDIIGEDLYPVTGSLGKLSASFDGLTMGEDIAFEHKTLNNELRAVQSAEDLPIQYRIQMEQQLLVSGAEKCLFMASKWNNDDTLETEIHFDYYPDEVLRSQIVAGWEQFEIELTNHAPVTVIEPAKAEAIKDLPMVSIQVKGELTTCNLDSVKPHFDKFLSEAITTMTTDDDFARAEAEAKLGRETAKRCKLTAKAVVDQMLSISEVTRTLEDYAAKFDALALKQEKAVKEQKEARKITAKLERDKAYADHISSLNVEINPIALILTPSEKPDFVGVMKGQRTLASIYNKLDTELARAKISADAVAKDIRAKLALCRTEYSDYQFLFSDIQQIIYKPIDDFKLTLTSRIEAHQNAEAARLEAEREKIRLEEETKAKREAEAKLRAEQAEKERVEREAKQAAELVERERLERENQEMLELAASKADKPVDVAPEKQAEVEHVVEQLINKTSAKQKPTREQLIAAVCSYFEASPEEAESWLANEFGKVAKAA